jgi:tetratricopeptide (TPR) repeat protein
LTAFVVPLLVFLIYEWYKRRRRRLMLARERRRKAPYAWPIRTDAPLPKLFESEQFYRAARLLRRRQVDEFYRLDVEATVSATVASLGFPSFRYRSASKPPEYLALIDRASFRDHQAQLFNELTKALEAEGVFVARYFYDEDPRVVRDESGEESLHLNELQNRYGTHRLLLFGDGAKLIDQLTGKLEMWTALLMNWQDRAVLTPEPARSWSLRESALAQHFVLLPATLEGLQSLVDYFEAAVTPDMRVWMRDQGASGGAPLDFDRPINIKMLRDYLGKDVFEWLCACAIYPELHWDLTLYLGALPSLGNNLVQEKNLLRLAGLPWFRTGSMPDNLRWLLINELPPEKARAIRTSLIQLLEKNAPPRETVAEESYRLNLVAQRWLHSRSRERLRELLALMRKLPRSVALRDQTLIRSLESAPQLPLNLTLPPRFRKFFYQSGLPAFGLRTSARLLLALMTIGVAWVAIMALAPRSQQPNNLSALIANSLPAPTPELFPGYPPPDYTAQNLGLDPSAFPPVTDPNANVSGFPSAQDFPQAVEQPQVNTPPASTPPATGGGPRFPRASKQQSSAQKPDAAASPTPQPTPTPFPPLNATAQNAGTQQPPVVNQTTDTITPASALSPQQGAPSQQLVQQKAPNKVSKGDGQTALMIENRVRAARAFQQAEQLRAQATAALLPQVVNKYEEALASYRSAGDREGEAVMLYNIGKVYADLGDNQKALDYLNRALQLLRAIKYQPGEASALNNIAVVYNSLGEREKALEYYKQALAVAQQANNRAGHAAVLSNVGKIYEGVGDKTIAQEFYDQSRSVWQTDLSPDKKMRATVSDNRQVKLTDATTNQELRTLSGHTAAVFELSFSPDGKYLATASDDGRIKIWNVESGQEQLNFPPEATTAYHLSFSPDGKTITTTETSGRVRVWDTATGRLLSTTGPPAPSQQQQQNAPK